MYSPLNKRFSRLDINDVINFTGLNRTVALRGEGGGPTSVVPEGPFTNRSIGGGARAQIYGTRQYGSGYPGVTTHGVEGRGLPFYFWPIYFLESRLAFGSGQETEYLQPKDLLNALQAQSRPGLDVQAIDFASKDTTYTGRFYVVADELSSEVLSEVIRKSCAVHDDFSRRYPMDPPRSSQTMTRRQNTNPLNWEEKAPRPEQALQYYRASTIGLFYDGYNNTAVYAPEGTLDVPIPTNIDAALLDCLNKTIGENAPLAKLTNGSSLGFDVQSSMSVFGLVYVVWCLLSLV